MITKYLSKKHDSDFKHQKVKPIRISHCHYHMLLMLSFYFFISKIARCSTNWILIFQPLFREINDNPIHCDCKLLAIPQFRKPGTTKVTCATTSNPEIQNVELDTLTPQLLRCGESRTWLKTLQCHPILFPTLFGRRTTVRIIFTNLHSQNFTTYFNRWNVVYQNMKEYSQKMQTIANFANQIFIEHHFGCISNN